NRGEGNFRHSLPDAVKNFVRRRVIVAFRDNLEHFAPLPGQTEARRLERLLQSVAIRGMFKGCYRAKRYLFRPRGSTECEQTDGLENSAHESEQTLWHSGRRIILLFRP